MVFTKRLRDGVRHGRIRCSIRIWKYPHVKVGGRYPMDEGHIVVDSIERIPLTEVTNDRARESGFTSQIVSHFGESYPLNQVNDDVTFVHRITTTHFYMRVLPDADAASDSTVPDSVAKTLGEYHLEPRGERFRQGAHVTDQDPDADRSLR